MSRVDELCLKLLDDSIDDAEADELAMLTRSPEGRDTLLKTFALEAHLHTSVHSSVAEPVLERIRHQRRSRIEEGVMRSVRQLRPARATRKSKRGTMFRRLGFYGIFAAVAVCLLLVVRYSVSQLRGEKDSIATLVQQSGDALWEGQTFRVGDSMIAKTANLKSGIVRMQYVDGVEVTVQGPARYELLDVGRARLQSGLLTAVVPAGAEGFKVETPNADVLDLGTAFGVQLREDGKANVSVFDGQVRVLSKGGDSSELLNEGDSVEVTDSTSITPVDIHTSTFESLWPVFSGINSSSNNFRVLPPWPRRLGDFQSDEMVVVLPEGYPIDLNSPLRLNLNEPGEYRQLNESNSATLRAGCRVRSYLLLFRPVATEGRQVFSIFEGSITFDRPILGVICGPTELLASDRVFNDRIAGQLPEYRALELGNGANGDRITLSKDRRRLSVRLCALNRRSDDLRVIVNAEPSR